MADIATEMVMKKLRVLGLCNPWAWAPSLCRAAPRLGRGQSQSCLPSRGSGCPKPTCPRAFNPHRLRGSWNFRPGKPCLQDSSFSFPANASSWDHSPTLRYPGWSSVESQVPVIPENLGHVGLVVVFRLLQASLTMPLSSSLSPPPGRP